MSTRCVAGLAESKSDLPGFEKPPDALKALEVSFAVKLTSARRTPNATHACVKDAEERGCRLSIAATGSAGAKHAGYPAVPVPSFAEAVRAADAELQQRL